MGYRRRQRVRDMANVDVFYEAPGGNMEAWSGEEDLDYSASFPGPRETRYADSANWGSSIPTRNPDVRDYVDWAAGGIPGYTKCVGSVGVTDPQTVDAHDFVGQMAVIRRMPDTNYGPASGETTAGYNSLLQMLYAMSEGNQFYPNEVSQADVIKAV